MARTIRNSTSYFKHNFTVNVYSLLIFIIFYYILFIIFTVFITIGYHMIRVLYGFYKHEGGVITRGDVDGYNPTPS